MSIMIAVGDVKYAATRPHTADAAVRASLISAAEAISERLIADDTFGRSSFSIDCLYFDGVDVSARGGEIVDYEFPELDERGLEDWAVRVNDAIAAAADVVFAEWLGMEGEEERNTLFEPTGGVCGFLISACLPRVLAQELVPANYVTDGVDVIHHTWRWDAALPTYPMSFNLRMKLETQNDVNGFLDAYSADVLGTCWQMDEHGEFLSGRMAENFCLGAVFGAVSHVAISPKAVSERMSVSLGAFPPMAETWLENGLENGVPPAELESMRPILVEPTFIEDSGRPSLPNLPQTAARAIGIPAGPVDPMTLCLEQWQGNRATGCDVLLVTLHGPANLVSTTGTEQFYATDILSFWMSPSAYYLKVDSGGAMRLFLIEEGAMVDITLDVGE